MSSLTSLYGGGGGGTPVNSISQLYVRGQVQYTDESGGVWLKTGNVIDADAATYPDAIVNPGIERSVYTEGYYMQDDSDPSSVVFNTNGTRMFILGRGTDKVFQFDLSTPFNVSTQSYSGVNITTSTEDTLPKDLAFNTDGTKMYILGDQNNSFYQYTLTTGFDLATASYDSVVTAAYTSSPQGFTFNNDGTKIFVVSGGSNKNVSVVNLSTAFDISTASLDVNVEVSTGQKNIAFNADGTELYILRDIAPQRIDFYTLSTPYDITTRTYIAFFNISAQTTFPLGLNFNDDMTKMYVVGQRSIYQYNVGEDFMGLQTNTATYEYLKLK